MPIFVFIMCHRAVKHYNYFTMPGLKIARNSAANPWARANIVLEKVCKFYKMTETKVKAKTRKREIVQARQICYHLIRNTCPFLTLKSIGEMFGARDHTTIIHGINTMNELLDTSDEIKADYLRIMQMVSAEID